MRVPRQTQEALEAGVLVSAIKVSEDRGNRESETQRSGSVPRADPTFSLSDRGQKSDKIVLTPTEVPSPPSFRRNSLGTRKEDLPNLCGTIFPAVGVGE